MIVLHFGSLDPVFSAIARDNVAAAAAADARVAEPMQLEQRVRLRDRWGCMNNPCIAHTAC